LPNTALLGLPEVAGIGRDDETLFGLPEVAGIGRDDETLFGLPEVAGIGLLDVVVTGRAPFPLAGTDADDPFAARCSACVRTAGGGSRRWLIGSGAASAAGKSIMGVSVIGVSIVDLSNDDACDPFPLTAGVSFVGVMIDSDGRSPLALIAHPPATRRARMGWSYG
jgi:hypothetical protein